MFEIVGIYTKPLKKRSPEKIFELLKFLEERGVKYFIDEQTGKNVGTVKNVVKGDELPSLVDLIVVFGGDGTMLSVSRKIGNRDTPVIGINFGYLGFLTQIKLGNMTEELKRVFDGNFRYENRMRLEVEVVKENNVKKRYIALNDAVINKGAIARIINLKTYVDGIFLSRFRADGLIVSTPTGSTAYNLSSGGPIVVPEHKNFVLTPICPHTLTNRPIVLSPTSIIEITLENGEDVMLTVDGQTGLELKNGDSIRIKKSPYPLTMVIPNDLNFFDVLREKLKWGEK